MQGLGQEGHRGFFIKKKELKQLDTKRKLSVALCQTFALADSRAGDGGCRWQGLGALRERSQAAGMEHMEAWTDKSSVKATTLPTQTLSSYASSQRPIS